MTSQPNINLSSLWTGLAQAAAIGTFVLVFNMYVDQSVMKEQQKSTQESVDKLEKGHKDMEKRITQLEMILPQSINLKKKAEKAEDDE